MLKLRWKIATDSNDDNNGDNREGANSKRKADHDADDRTEQFPFVMKTTATTTMPTMMPLPSPPMRDGDGDDGNVDIRENMRQF